MRRSAFLCVLLAFPAMPAFAQAHDHGAMGHTVMNMADMDGAQMDMMQMDRGVLGPYPQSREASGTSWQPDAASHGGVHTMLGDWMVMGHLRLDAIYDWQTGPRGDDMPFLAGMASVMARRDFSHGTLNLRAMLSPDPFMGKRGYPLLLAAGETADGTTHLVDRQHPHDLFMELSASYSHRLSEQDSAFVYFGYPGEPAFGPAVFMHRASGMDNPQAPISHHWLDSTHITFGVVTAGFVHQNWKLEMSRFTGREPDQYRFNFDSARFDSTAARLSWNPDSNWSLQASWAFLKSPEQLSPLENETRYSLSATYVRHFDGVGQIAATAAWGRKHNSAGLTLNALLAEAEWKPAPDWAFFTRVEWVENAELLHDGEIARPAKFTLGGVRSWPVAEHLKLGLGALYDFNFTGGALAPVYGSSPRGAMVFTRLSME
ncbi:MAG: hypothetical protein J0I02_05560 [Alphaproteobacteria bacterium]|nr:hypothetical protein [Alphaproteobacteria bacterium]